MDTQTKDIAPGDRTTFGVVRWKYCQKCGQWYQGKQCPICGRTRESISERKRAQFGWIAIARTLKRLRYTPEQAWEIRDELEAEGLVLTGPTGLPVDIDDLTGVLEGLGWDYPEIDELVDRLIRSRQESIGEARLSGRVRIYHDLPYKDAIFIYPLSGVSIEQLHEILWGSGVKLKGLFPMEELGVLQVAIRGRQDLSDFTEDVKAVLEAAGIRVVPKIGRLGDLEPKFLGQESLGEAIGMRNFFVQGDNREALFAYLVRATGKKQAIALVRTKGGYRGGHGPRGSYDAYDITGQEDQWEDDARQWLGTSDIEWKTDLEDEEVFRVGFVSSGRRGDSVRGMGASDCSFADAILEDTARDMKRMTDPSFLDQGRRKKKVGEPELVEMEPDDTMVFRVESGTEPGKFYTLNTQLLGWEEAKADKRASLSRRAKKALGSNLRLRCSCPSFLFHGFQYIETIRDSQFGPAEHRYPEVRNPELKGIVCKHLARLLDELPRFEYDLYKYLKRD